MIEKIDISNPSIAEEVRKKMAVVTANSAGLMPNTGFIYRGAVREGTDLNTIVDPGFYAYYIELGNIINGPGMNRIILLCFKALVHVIQVAYSVDPANSSIKYRGSFNNGTNWSPWKSISIT